MTFKAASTQRQIVIAPSKKLPAKRVLMIGSVATTPAQIAENREQP
jgi:hypothetical protein